MEIQSSLFMEYKYGNLIDNDYRKIIEDNYEKRSKIENMEFVC